MERMNRRSQNRKLTAPPRHVKRDSTENELIQRIRSISDQPQGSYLVLGIGDDAALFKPKDGCQTILTCDWFLESTHFLLEKHPADAVGWKCLARAASDIAAMGGQARCFLLSLALPATRTGRWLNEFLAGLKRAARKFDCPLAGGDTTRRAEIIINTTVIGEIESGKATLRSGANPGDVIFVSGRLGEAELGLRLLRNRPHSKNIKNRHLKKHLYPEPRLQLGQWLVKTQVVTSMMDLSDGLSSDLSRLCSASNVGAEILVEKLPTVKLAEDVRDFDRLQLALHGGDDYELLFTVPGRKSQSVPPSFKGVKLTAIGEITDRSGVCLVHSDSKKSPLQSHGWDPFRKSVK